MTVETDADDRMDALLTEYADQWCSGFTEPELRFGSTAPHRSWVRPLVVAAALLAAAAVTVTVLTTRPIAVGPAVAPPATTSSTISSIQSTTDSPIVRTPIAAVERIVPSEIVVNGTTLDAPYEVLVMGIVLDERDPAALWLQAGSCGGAPLRSYVVREDAERVRVRLVMYRKAGAPILTNCVFIGPVRVNLTAPLGNRDVFDGSSSIPEHVVRPDDYPAPTNVPSELAQVPGPALGFWYSGSQSVVRSWATSGGSTETRLSITWSRYPTTLTAATVLSRPDINGSPGVLYRLPDDGRITTGTYLDWISPGGVRTSLRIGNNDTALRGELVAIARSMSPAKPGPELDIPPTTTGRPLVVISAPSSGR